MVGASGFLGRNIVARGRTAAVDVAGLRAPRVAGTSGTAWDAADQWRRNHPETFETFCSALETFEVVVNAAGAATPGVGASRTLFEANAVLPVVVAQAAAEAGVRRLVHLSTASVQGRLDPLDDTTRTFPSSPYTLTKAEGEAALLAGAGGRDIPPEVVLYRPRRSRGPTAPRPATSAASPRRCPRSPWPDEVSVRPRCRWSRTWPPGSCSRRRCPNRCRSCSSPGRD